MNVIDAKNMHFQTLGELVRNSENDIEINNCCGQRYIAAGSKERNVTVTGTPGNALGAYLDGAVVTVHGNAQDAVGDTMNAGRIIVHGNLGDAAGYAMRGGRIFASGTAGYRAGIHMKQYKDKQPAIVIGQTAGSFLGEYLAGGIIAVLNLANEPCCTGNFTGTGMHGGAIFLRCEQPPRLLPEQVCASVATPDDMQPLRPLIDEYCSLFGGNADEIFHSKFYILKPNAKNPYKKMYVNN